MVYDSVGFYSLLVFGLQLGRSIELPQRKLVWLCCSYDHDSVTSVHSELAQTHEILITAAAVNFKITFDVLLEGLLCISAEMTYDFGVLMIRVSLLSGSRHLFTIGS
jgi:hypothetical protein